MDDFDEKTRIWMAADAAGPISVGATDRMASPPVPITLLLTNSLAVIFVDDWFTG